MSNKGIFTALSGAMAQSARLDTIANNIANVNTTSFKKDKQIFNEYLTANEKGTDVIQSPRIPASIESFYEMQGGDRGFVDSSRTYTDFTQGPVNPTGNSLDVAIEGEGFFEVLTPSGIRFTRNGAFKMGVNGNLVTKDGYPVLKEGLGQPGEGRVISVESANVTISYSGEVYEAGQLLGKLSVVEVGNKDALEKVGSSFYKIKDTINPQLTVAADYKTQQGFLERSNVNIVQEMTDMIAATRAFETNQKSIKAFDEMNEKLVNIVPKTT